MDEETTLLNSLGIGGAPDVMQAGFGEDVFKSVVAGAITAALLAGAKRAYAMHKARQMAKVRMKMLNRFDPRLPFRQEMDDMGGDAAMLLDDVYTGNPLPDEPPPPLLIRESLARRGVLGF